MATFSISSSIHVNVPPAVAFVYVADLTRHNEWNPGLKVTAISEGPTTVGSRFQSVGHVMGRDFGPIGDFTLDGAVKIWKRCSEHGDPLLETHAVGGHSRTRMVADAMGGDQLVHDSQLALVEGFIQHAAEDGLALKS